MFNAAPPRVDVLLATYNGAKYLDQQLASIEAQTCGDWRLIARDDGSRDATREILARFRLRHPDRVVLIEDAETRLGPAQNFHRLLSCSTAEYIAFCDQDDVWRPIKLGRLIGLVETAVNPRLPLLAHSDLELIDHASHTIARSMWKYQFVDPSRCGVAQLLAQNVVTGCACLINAALREKALPIPKEAVMHDSWLALVAAAVGKILWTRDPLVQYRQHGGNDVGARKWGLRFFLTHGRRALGRRAVEAMRREIAAQARALARHAAVADLRLSRERLAMLQQVGAIETTPRWRRAAILLRHGVLRTGVLRNANLLLRL
jgi:glycosyltransferase involved in cell wall biosynthesis